MIIRASAPEDAVFLQEIHTACSTRTMRSYYSEEQTAAWLKDRRSEGYLEAVAQGENFVIAETDGQVIGFAFWRSAALCALFVHPDYQGKGVGKELLSVCVTALAGSGVELIKLRASMNAIGFYEKCGFIRQALADDVRHGVAIPYARMQGAVWRIRDCMAAHGPS